MDHNQFTDAGTLYVHCSKHRAVLGMFSCSVLDSPTSTPGNLGFSGVCHPLVLHYSKSWDFIQDVRIARFIGSYCCCPISLAQIFLKDGPVPCQKRWFAKRFLHPDIVASFEYIFIWDEDLGVDHFNAEEYLKLVRKHGLEISQPGLEPRNGLTWQMTKRRGDVEMHKETEERPGWCHDPHLPPCAGRLAHGYTALIFCVSVPIFLRFVEIMAPVFSRKAWRCVWHLIQNDLVHGWGLDLSLQRCVEVSKQFHILRWYASILS
eukprot:Gb_04030 [translate_table: standard]